MAFCDVPVLSSVCDAAGEGAAALVAGPFEWLANAMGEAAAWMFESVWAIFDTTTLVDITSGEYIAVYNLIFGIAIFVMFIFFCLQLITGAIRREPGALSRAALGLGKSVIGSFVVITLTALLLEIVDRLSTGIIQAAGETTASMGEKITLLVAALTTLNLTAPGVGAIITIFLGGLAIVAAAIVWLSLLVRKALILVAVVLAPLAFSGASWDATRGWVSKWAMFVIALALSKLVLVVILLVAITQVSAPIEADLASVADPLAGIVLMALAGFAPYMTYRFLSFIGFDLYNAVGSEQEAKNALNRPVPTPGKPQGNPPKKVLDDGAKSDGGKKSGDDGGQGPKGSTAKTGTTGGNPGAGAGGGTGAGAGSASAGAGAGAGGGAGAGAGGGAAAGGPAAAIIAGAMIAKKAAEAGPQAGQELAGQAETAADGADQTGNAPSSGPSSTPPPSSTPLPKTPNDPGQGSPKHGPSKPPSGKE
ncbi:conjugal transfer protein TrbL [Brevibacterium casei]|uniref:Conjugal transfer protein TrbL n=1 Tax=Brevibacterium casei TaxID=33889 RepID=A0A7T2TGX2_9MICO|nr:conjugal transfer protein TrbL [Brevibacterium casei]QPS33574.1 conjugal transfer protein TrbL [Brevibacterium casei]